MVLVILPLSDTLWIPGGTALWGVIVALLVGTALGLISGYFGGWIDELVMRLLDAMMAVPIILLYLIIMAALGASAINVVIAMTICGTPGIARLVRSLTLDIRTREYIRAAQTRGESPWYIMFVEILPNARGPIIVDAMLRVGYAIFAMGTLGFLGLGLPPPSPDWGSMVAKGREFILAGSPWAALWPSVAIALAGHRPEPAGRRPAGGITEISVEFLIPKNRPPRKTGTASLLPQARGGCEASGEGVRGEIISPCIHYQFFYRI